MTSLILKPHSTPATLLWLQANYEPVEGVCIPRNSMYNQYVEFCRSHGMMPVNAGQSRYHYYGLAVKSDASLYGQSTFTRHGFTDLKPDQISVIQKAQNHCYIPHPLFNLPSIDILLGLPKNILRSEAETIHIMYTLHCQQLIDYSIHFQFKEVKQYIAHFWEGFPSHLSPLLGNNSIVSLIGVCDVITYRAITHATMPCVLMEEVPASRTEDTIRLAESIIDWLITSLVHTPQVLRRMKLHAARSLLHSVRRQASLNHLCCNLRFILSSDAHVKQMLTDWECVDVQVIADETNFSVGASKVNYASQIISCCKDLEKILKTRPQLSELGDWMKELVEHCVSSHIENYKSTGENLKNFACNFVLIWSSIGSRILRELTLLGAHSFGAFHLLYLMLSDYGAQLVESLIAEERIHRLTSNVGIGNPPESDDFEAGTLCDAQCPCKCLYHQDETVSYGETSVKGQSGANGTSSTSCIHGETLSDSSIEFCSDPSDTTTQDASTYCQVYSDHSTVNDYCHPSEPNGSLPYDLQQSAAQQHLVTRPSCSFQGMMLHDEDLFHNVNVSSVQKSSSGATVGVGTVKNEFKFLVSPEENVDMTRSTINHVQDHCCVPTHPCNGNGTGSTSCSGSEPGQGCPDDSSTFYTSTGPEAGVISGLCDSSGQNGNNTGYYTVSSISASSGGQCVDNFYSMEATGFNLTSPHLY